MRAAALLCALPGAAASAAPKVDVVVLRNGSRVIGEIRSMTKSRLELKTDDMGTLQIEWDNVTQVTAPEFFEVEHMNGGLSLGALRPGKGEDTLEVVADWGTDELELWQVARIQLVKGGFWDKFRGSFDVGAGYTSATELLQLDFDGELRYTRPRFEAFAQADAVVTQQPEADDTRRSSLTLGYTRIFPNRHRIFTQAALEQNRELGFDLRSSVLGGWAYALARDRKNQLVGGAGLAVNREKPIEGESTTNIEAVLGLRLRELRLRLPEHRHPDLDVRLPRAQPVGPLPPGGEREPQARAVLGLLLRAQGLRKLRQRAPDRRRPEERLGPEPFAGVLVLSRGALRLRYSCAARDSLARARPSSGRYEVIP